MKALLVTIVFMLLLTCTLHAQVIQVPGDQTTIQAAIDMAVDADTVLVAQGEYFENINFKGKNIVVCSNYVFTLDSADINNTIINGGDPVYPDTASCVLIVSGEDSTAVLQGFTITGGTGTRWEDEHGPNHWYTEGGGILVQYSSPTIRNNVITGNEAIAVPSGTSSAGGGAIRCGDSNPHILNNIISFNQGRYGGGIVLNYSGAVIKNNIFNGNSGGEDYGGGGLWFLSNGDEPILLENNTIVNNSSALGGGGIRLWSSIATLTNNIFWGNTASSSPQIQGNQGTVTYCCIEGGFTGTGNIESDPGFLDKAFILSDDSDCVDAGDPGEAYYDPEDPLNAGFAHYPARGTVHSDIGAYGGPGCELLDNPVTGVDNGFPKQLSSSLLVYPSPASSFITLSGLSQIKGDPAIRIFDIRMGQWYEPRQQERGDNELKLDVSKLSPGIYLVEVTAGNEKQVVKFIKK